MFGKSSLCGIGYQNYVGNDGWTVFNASRDTRIIYVSSSIGSNTFDGLAPDNSLGGTSGPKADFSNSNGGPSLLRNGFPDWCLAKRGDVWIDPAISGNRGGRSEKELMMFGVYGSGTARPKLVQRITSTSTVDINQFVPCNVAFVGLEFYAECFDPSSANFLGATIVGDTASGSNVITNIASIPAVIVPGYVTFGTGVQNFTVASVGANSITLNAGQNASFTATQIPIQVINNGSKSGWNMSGLITRLIIEDCSFRFCGVSPGSSSVTPYLFPSVPKISVRRCHFNRPWQLGKGACAFVAPNYNDGKGFVEFVECTMHHGGWHEVPWGAAADKFKHNLYLHDPSSSYNITGCINSYGSATGAQHRDGGTDYNNLWIANPVSVFGAAETSNWLTSNSVICNGSEIIGGYRTATQAHSSGATLHMDGICGTPNTPPISSNIANLSNPLSIPANTSISSITSSTSCVLSAAIVSGQRGDGIQVGDTLVFWQAPDALAYQVLNIGTNLAPGPATVGSFFEYQGPTTVSISGTGGSCIVTETGVTNARSAGDPFQFTAGSLPPELALNTTYYTLDTGVTYRIALTSGGVPIITTGGATSGVTRSGARLFMFGQSLVAFSPPINIPPWVNVGDKVEASGGAGTTPSVFAGNSTTVAQIAPDRSWLITADPCTRSITGNGQTTFIFAGPNSPGAFRARFGPGNIILNSRALNNSATTGIAIDILDLTSNTDVSGNFIYNWGNSAANILDENTQPSYSATNILTQTLNVSGSTLYPKASVEAYDAVTRNNQFAASITANGTGLGTLIVTSGTPPVVGDYIFDVNFAGLVPQYTYVCFISGGGAIYVAQYGGSIGSNVSSTTMINGSDAHFIAQAMLNGKDAGWNTSWTAPVANNFIRTAMGLATI